jgi:hypothetical protein
MTNRRYLGYLSMVLVVLALTTSASSQTSSTRRTSKKAVKPAVAKSHSLLTPTSEFVSVSGRVTTSTGEGIQGAIVTVSGGDLTYPVGVRTTATGDYRVERIPAGSTYVVTVRAKRHQFTNPSRPVSVLDDVTGVDFVAQP